jgi:hypothetical protein
VVREGDVAGKDFRVQFRGHAEKLPAQLGAHYDPGLDLAVRTVPNLKAHGIDMNAFPFGRLGDPTVMVQGDPVFLAGHPQGVLWSVTVTPTHLSKRMGTRCASNPSHFSPVIPVGPC